jgi:hypothetical protein
VPSAELSADDDKRKKKSTNVIAGCATGDHTSWYWAWMIWIILLVPYVVNNSGRIISKKNNSKDVDAKYHNVMNALSPTNHRQTG